MDKTLAWLWLADAVGSACQYAQELLALYPDPAELYDLLRAGTEAPPTCLTPRALAQLQDTTPFDFEERLDHCLLSGIELLTPDEDTYPAALRDLPDEEVCARLSALEGIGVWSAEMLMLHSLRRPDILSYGDLAVRRGLRMLHGHREIDRALFEKYRRRYSPCGSVACIYLWAVSSGAIAELKDHGLKRQPHGNPKKS